MKYLLLILGLFLLLSCSTDERAADPTGPVPIGGVSKTFTINTGNNYQYCTELYGALGSGPDLYCINKGYEKATRWTTFENCRNNGGNHPGPWLKTITCWKP